MRKILILNLLDFGIKMVKKYLKFKDSRYQVADCAGFEGSAVPDRVPRIPARGPELWRANLALRVAPLGSHLQQKTSCGGKQYITIKEQTTRIPSGGLSTAGCGGRI